MPLMRTVGRTAVIAGTASAVNGRVSRRQQRRWSDQEAEQAAQQQAAAPAPPPAAPTQGTSMDEKVESLKKLAELKEQGILSEEEFAAQKAQILGS
jgi:hypothetical protein